MKRIEFDGRSTPPEWAIRQRHLIDQMNRAAPKYVDRYTRSDGTLIWRDEWPGIDGSDDPYEGFVSLCMRPPVCRPLIALAWKNCVDYAEVSISGNMWTYQLC